MPAKKLTITAAACPQQKPCPHAGANAGIHRLKAIANTSEGLRLLPPSPDAASWCVADAGAGPPWHHDAALRAGELKDGVTTAHRYLSQVKRELMKGNVEHPLMQRFHEIFTVEPNSDEAEALLATLLPNIEGTETELSRHINDNFSRIWLVDHDDPNLVGEVYRKDPLKRIFINFKKSGAYQHNKRINIKCRFLCSHYKSNDDVATFLHEASHNAVKTEDYFYLDSLEGQRPLNEELDRLSRGDIAKKEARGIIDTAKTLKVTLPPFKDKPLARMLYNYYPQVRGRFLMQNADSFSQIVMELADRIEPKAKRDTASRKRLNAEVLALFITRALWLADAAREGG